MQNVYTVAQVNSYIKNMFTQDFMLQSIFIKGEASNVKYHSSGHIYFTLKDIKGTITCVMFAGNRGNLAFRLTDGQQIIVSGNIDVYERDGKYQLYAKEILLDGAGLLYEKFELLKRELEEMGMFDPLYKKPIPKYINVLGVVTAPTGAAVQDIINIASRRNPYVQIIVYPTIVQGEAAAASIINGIRALEQKKADVIIIGRGGGSIEDLWAFNEKIVAQAIFDCEVPVISAVGHETDVTIADFVSDLRAPTPSAAAELAVYDIHILTEKLSAYKSMLNRTFVRKIERYRDELKYYELKLAHVSPLNRIKEKRMRSMQLEEKLQEMMKQVILRKRHALAIYVEQMKGLSPLEKLNQGFSFVEDSNGKPLTDIEKVNISDAISIHMKNGKLSARVEKKENVLR